jgi:hypothetical protein
MVLRFNYYCFLLDGCEVLQLHCALIEEDEGNQVVFKI